MRSERLTRARRRTNSQSAPASKFCNLLSSDELQHVLFSLDTSSLRTAACTCTTWHESAAATFIRFDWQAHACAVQTLLKRREVPPAALKLRLNELDCEYESFAAASDPVLSNVYRISQAQLELSLEVADPSGTGFGIFPPDFQAMASRVLAWRSTLMDLVETGDSIHALMQDVSIEDRVSPDRDLYGEGETFLIITLGRKLALLLPWLRALVAKEALVAAEESGNARRNSIDHAFGNSTCIGKRWSRPNQVCFLPTCYAAHTIVLSFYSFLTC